ncbi:uncharacterized protein [Diadema antillarum]|uniref:uncharacterized protein n=1 Tax=Diadema antillarum TaxID=105358 RepID=UPI003A8AEC21
MTVTTTGVTASRAVVDHDLDQGVEVEVGKNRQRVTSKRRNLRTEIGPGKNKTKTVVPVSRSRNRSRSRDRDREKSRSSHRSSRRYSSSRSRSRSRDRDYPRSSKKRHRRSRSRSRSRHRSPSDSPPVRRGRRSRSHSSSRSRSRERRRSRSRSVSRDRQSSRASSSSRKEAQSKGMAAEGKTAEALDANPAQSIKVKMQKALEAAACADAKLREQGVLNTVKQDVLTPAEELKRKKVIDKIEKDGFQPKNFSSSAGDTKVEKGNQGAMSDVSHDAAIFGALSTKSDAAAMEQTYVRGPRYKTKTFVSQAISASSEEKEARWIEKLQAMRKERLRANPSHYRHILLSGKT